MVLDNGSKTEKNYLLYQGFLLFEFVGCRRKIAARKLVLMGFVVGYGFDENITG